MNQEHGQSKESTTVAVRGIENEQDIYVDTDGGEALSGVSTRFGGEWLGLDREASAAGIGDFDPFGGVIDQLIDDARKQLVKSQECIVWYRSEADEYKQKLDNLIKLKELQQQQQQLMRQQQQLLGTTEQTHSSNQNGEEDLAE
ncbi:MULTISPECIES: hypothetical protein [unclassified Microcoleus]|uniref:hypothetical protein n=1 Tax=unclassified Microcoleus TaxID=2642155 RepID=UPI002FD11D18